MFPSLDVRRISHFMGGDRFVEHEASERIVERVVHKRAFPGARDARDRDEHPEWHLEVDVLQIVRARAFQVTRVPISVRFAISAG